MTKCGKSFLPECEYFATNGCVSPFNCSYKAEENITTATSCNLYPLETDKDKEISRLKAENAELRARLDRAVELPLKAGSTVYIIHETDEEDKFNPWIDTGRIVTFSFDVKLWIFVRYNSGLTMWYSKDTFDKEVCLTLEAAEARLVELKGEKK